MKSQPPRFRRPTLEGFHLPNGLEVWLAPIPSSPTSSVWVWYRVGSKNERPGITVASHWVEHMLFTGSPRYRKGEIDRAIVSVGGTLNAFTSYDVTAYYSTVPREFLDVPLDIESDRLTRAAITDPETDRERSVVLSERERNENWPEFRVEEELQALAFRHHPYRWDPLGYRRDIESMTGSQLREYYRRFYGPRNAVLIVAGGFEPRRTRREIVRRFGPLPTTGEDPRVRIEEPMARGERRAKLTGPGTTPLLEIGYRAPSVFDAQTPSTLLLDAIFGGDAWLFGTGGGWGRAKEHPSSRLYRSLVDAGLAVRAVSEFHPRVHPSLFTTTVLSAPGVRLDRVEGTVDAAMEELKRTGPTREEMREARLRIARGAALAYEGASRTAFRVGWFASMRSPTFERELYGRILKVRANEVREAARAIFDPSSRVIVTYEPTSPGDP